ncbi:hypothetical protein Acor_60340 [Acrocarpospora corrugata]|uniref:Uncharacterized protein n=1 Tax=Acrocarpospora corrugata TaxID=35763 RepID=A0A5M3WC11_9ACTN|nr:hypothetical protein [Acrocarpospora corrugata]GES03968.1 hypothetical protein Acor_60340 [Acrocarpospora corrugata]
MLGKIAALSSAGVTTLGMLGITSASASADEAKRRVVVSGTVYIMDDENFGTNERCTYSLLDNDLVFNSQQMVIDQSWSCGGEVLTELHGFVELLPGNAIRYHGEVVLREGQCGCQEDTIRVRKGFNQVVQPETQASVATGRVEWSGGDATDINLQVLNINP